MHVCIHTHFFFFVHSSFDEYLGCFPYSTIVNSASVNVRVHASFGIISWFSQDICPGVGLLGHIVALF